MRSLLPLVLIAFACNGGDGDPGEEPDRPGGEQSQGDDTGGNNGGNNGSDDTGSGDDTGGNGGNGGNGGEEIEGWTHVSGDLYEQTLELTTDSSGFAQVQFDLEGARSFLVTGAVAGSDDWVSVEFIRDPNGDKTLAWEDWYYGPYSLTYAFIPADNTTVNWPVRAEDGPIADGQWTVVLGAYDEMYNYVSGVNVGVTVSMSRDMDTSAGSMDIVVVYAEGLDEDAEVTAGVEAAVEHWAWIWDKIGAELSVRYESSDISPDLNDPSYGSAQLSQASQYGENDEVVVLVGDTIGGTTWTYGVSGNIPGALNPTKNSGVVVSWLSCAGQDGQFNDAEIEDLGETLAHEVGHYVGLFHPVEDGFRSWDALDDTVECESWQDCEEQLGENLMFPYPICDFGGSCGDQNQLSDDQAGVSHHYTGMQ